ncbi:type VII secretion protein EccB [Catenulispora sp. MAP5-51]|uniref:type VII secretion protein EccB n=1 Tax=Catenulispora sp. MAP5-51 TaxID=3156298 RepID=UPI003515DCFF
MWTERDQIQAYQFLRRRLVSALVTSDPNHPTSPHRRLVMGTVLGTVATMLTAAGFGISGMMAPSPPPDWQHTGLVIVDSDGGGRYVLDNTGVLHPVTNLASARLLANGTKTVTVTTALLRNTPRGATLGIANAPDMLPDPANVIPAPDPVACSRATSDIPKVTGPVGALLLANAGDATSALNGMVPLPDGRALLVQTPKGERYLITGGLKYKVADDAVMTALGYQAATILPAAASWLSTLPSGRDLALVTVPNVGGSGPRVGGTKRKVGEVLTVNNTVTDKTLYYLVQAGGLEQIPQIEAALIVADNANAAAYTDGPQQPRAVSVSDATATPSTPAGDDTKGYPAGVPTPVGGLGGGTVVCAVGDGTTPAQIALSGTFPLPQGARTVPTGAPQGGAIADEIYLPPGTAALATIHTDATTQPDGTQQNAPVYLITDAGTKYPLTDGQARAALGYPNNTPATLPTTALAMLPTGPGLDEADAQKAVVVVGN